MPRLSKDEKKQVEIFAQRQAELIYAMTEGGDRLTGMPQEAFLQLYKKIMAEDDGQMITPKLADLEDFTVRMKNKVDEFRRGNTPEHAMRMMKAGNAGAMMMNNHMEYNHPRLADAVGGRMTEIHHTVYRKRWEALGVLLPNGHVKIGDQVSLNPIGNFRPHNEDPNLFDPSDDSRNPKNWRKITFDEFKNADDNHLFNSIFFFKDPFLVGHNAFELVGLKRTPNGIMYDVRWEGTSHAMEMESIELKERAELGLWATPKPRGA